MLPRVPSSDGRQGRRPLHHGAAASPHPPRLSAAAPHPRPEVRTAPAFIGVGVSKATLDVHVRPEGTTLQVPNTAAGVRKLVARCTRLAPERIVAEATGGLERPLVDALHAAKLPIVVAGPDRVRHFAKAARGGPPACAPKRTGSTPPSPRTTPSACGPTSGRGPRPTRAPSPR